MRKALKEAQKALSTGEFPVGCVLVGNNEILATGSRTRTIDTLANEVDHAEMVALRRLAQRPAPVGHSKITLYCTLEPCLMCAGALVNARVDRVVFGAFDEKAGACGSLYQVGLDARLNHRFEVTGGVLRDECAAILGEFFARKR